MTTEDAVKDCINRMDTPLLKQTLKRVVDSNNVIKEGLFQLLLDKKIITRNNGHYEMRSNVEIKLGDNNDV